MPWSLPVCAWTNQVALLAERNLDLLGMIIGSFKAGAGYLPLDPGLPSQRLSRIIELSRTPLLVCSAACREQAQTLLEEFGCSNRPRLLVWEEVQASAAATHNLGIHSGPDNLAYVIYTSGSTGPLQRRDGRAARHAQQPVEQTSVPRLERGRCDCADRLAKLRHFRLAVPRRAIVRRAGRHRTERDCPRSARSRWRMCRRRASLCWRVCRR